MFKKLLLVMLLCMPLFSKAAAVDTLLGQYYFTRIVSLYSCDINGTADNRRETSSEINQLFNVIAFTTDAKGNDVATIQIVDYHSGTSAMYLYNYANTAANYKALTDDERENSNFGQDQLYFSLPISTLQNAAKKYVIIRPSLTIGAINFPFKFRFMPYADFKGNFNFGAGIGYTFKHEKGDEWFHTILSGYSVSTINLDSSEVNRNWDLLNKINSFAALSLSLGYVISYEKAQAGIFIGWDILGRLNQQNFDWKFQGKPWISVGFGFAIWSPQKESKEAEKRQ